jgi:Spy/CpxP family protein refolding chaperone
MKFFNFKIEHWIILFLLVTNVSTIATFWYHKKAETKERELVQDSVPLRTGQGFGRMLKERLNLSDEQNQQMRDIRRGYHQQSNQITNQMQAVRTEIYQEMIKTPPDTVKIEKLAGEIGSLHKNLKMETVRFYGRMKANCQTSQQPQLDSLFKELSVDETAMPRGRGMGQGRRFRHGR